MVEPQNIGPQWQIARAEKIRAAMGPEWCAIADAVRATFGSEVKQVWLETPTLTLGTEPEEGICTQWNGERKRA